MVVTVGVRVDVGVDGVDARTGVDATVCAATVAVGIGIGAGSGLGVALVAGVVVTLGV